MEVIMKKIISLFCLVFSLSVAAPLYAIEFEIAGGAWYQSPSGNLSFDKTSRADDLDLENNLNYKDKSNKKILT